MSYNCSAIVRRGTVLAPGRLLPAVLPEWRSAAARLPRAAALTYSHSMTSTPDDSALMLRYRDGDVAAFETLYRRHNDSLYRYLLRLSLSRAAAEDIFQDVWIKIIRSRQNYRPTAKFSTFLYRVARNCFIDHTRRNKRYAPNSPFDPDSSANPADEPDVTAEKALARQRLNAALAALPDEQRDVFLLHEEGGLSIDIIAKVTGVNRETAKSRMRYAVGKLKAAIDESTADSTRAK